MRIVEVVEVAFGLALLASLRGLVLVLRGLVLLAAAFAVLVVFGYFALRWAGGF